MLLYLDNAATTRISQEVLEEMKKSLEHYGNTESKYYYCAEAAKKDVATARRRVANSIGCKVDEVIFTSGATESNNLILRGYAEANPRKKKIIISSIEHSSIEVPCEYLASKGYEIVKIPVDHTGLVDLDLLDKNIDDNTLLVSIIWVNNEIGTIQNIAAIDKICSKHNIFWHSDATQAVGKVDINLNKYSNLKFLTLTSHKIYGPKGIGALVIRKDNEKRIEVCSQIKGGDQEYGYRAGTLSNELIVGFGKACELVAEDINSSNEHLSCLEKKFIEKIRMYFGDKLVINNDFDDRVPGILNLQFRGINNMIFLERISQYIAASTGSACGISKPSHVLKAIGLSDIEISNSIRFSFSKYMSVSELDIIDDI